MKTAYQLFHYAAVIINKLYNPSFFDDAPNPTEVNDLLSDLINSSDVTAELDRKYIVMKNNMFLSIFGEDQRWEHDPRFATLLSQEQVSMFRNSEADFQILTIEIFFRLSDRLTPSLEESLMDSLRESLRGK